MSQIADHDVTEAIHCTYSGKVRYPGRREAQQACSRVSRRNTRSRLRNAYRAKYTWPYECFHCCGWHLTTSGKSNG